MLSGYKGVDIFKEKLSEIVDQIVLLQWLNKEKVDGVNTYEHREEHHLKSGSLEDEGIGEKMQIRFI